jgi:hypothetical protein
MQLDELSEGDVIEVSWDDATADAEWTTRKELDFPEMRALSVGYYVRHDKRALMMVGCLFGDYRKEDGTLGGMRTIPLPMVTKVKRLRTAERLRF